MRGTMAHLTTHAPFVFHVPRFLRRQSGSLRSSGSAGSLTANTSDLGPRIQVTLDCVQYRRMLCFMEDVGRYAMLAHDLDLGALVEGCHDDLARIYSEAG